MKLLTEKRREFNFESHLGFLDYVKVSDRDKRENLFEILQSKNIPTLSLKNVTEIYSGNKIKVEMSNKLSEEHTINPWRRNFL